MRDLCAVSNMYMYVTDVNIWYVRECVHSDIIIYK